METPTKPGFLPAYRRGSHRTTARVYVQPRWMILNFNRTRVEVIHRRWLHSVDVGEFTVPPPADRSDGFDQTAVDHELAQRGWRRTTEYDWPHGSGAYVAGIERIKR